jgi:hypothetical protein
MSADSTLTSVAVGATAVAAAGFMAAVVVNKKKAAAAAGAAKPKAAHKPGKGATKDIEDLVVKVGRCPG